VQAVQRRCRKRWQGESPGRFLEAGGGGGVRRPASPQLLRAFGLTTHRCGGARALLNPSLPHTLAHACTCTSSPSLPPTLALPPLCTHLLLYRLKLEEQLVVALRYGWVDGTPASFAAAGERMNRAGAAQGGVK
jgi:hypothetical protein